VKEFKYS